MDKEEYIRYLKDQRDRKSKILGGGVRLGLGVMCWEDSTFLRPILTELRSVCDYIVLGWQTISYTGKRLDEKTSESMRKEIDFLLESGLADEAIRIENISFNSFENERHKRNVLNRYLLFNKASVTMIIDSDEFHFADETVDVLEEMITSGYVRVYTGVKTFVKNISIEHPNPRTHIFNLFAVQGVPDVFVPVRVNTYVSDPTRTFDPALPTLITDKAFNYHLSWIRPDMSEKISGYSQPSILGPETSQLEKDLLLPDEQLLKRGYIIINKTKYKIQPCSYPKLEDRLNFLTSLKEDCLMV